MTKTSIIRTEHPLRCLWLAADRKTRETWASRAGTSYKYLQKLSAASCKFGTPSVEFLLNLKRTAIRGLDVEYYYPDWARR